VKLPSGKLRVSFDRFGAKARQPLLEYLVSLVPNFDCHQRVRRHGVGGSENNCFTMADRRSI
jgi:hypothetical protein